VKRWQLSPERYRLITGVALGLLSVIVVSGACVRLTGSGLGCDDWPNCNSAKFIDVSSTHAAIEQINRLVTGLVAVAVILAVLGSLARMPRRRDLTLLSLGLVAGVIGQIVLGGITVLVDLHPAAVQGHFLLSMVLQANAVALYHRARLPDGDREAVVTAPIRTHVRVLTGLTLLSVVLGTVVTGAGPHAGDEDARRFDLSISTAARVHGIAVWLAVAACVALLWRLRSRTSDRRVLDGPVVVWVCVAVAQAGIGYLQYFTGVPAALVAVHVAGATLLFSATWWIQESLFVRREPGTVVRDGSAAGEPAGELGALVDHG
jgi:cytochrome c oxidase assembly protein subunit 15